ncbi:hypothetical protein [Serratia oryzae]|uniref:Uncharacterized protein n=1 Tax=Serratia oryzae TaxID=2034155 RepID=A0A1S8CNV4_9GAMM|nr:hypothetical protein [Serratia oryzae]OMQ26975.1 hypothetical protein BMI79_01185 [Serratia oryzae]VXC79571.1 conserved hypothetical protein [Enterobacterales bacterium 8AC]
MLIGFILLVSACGYDHCDALPVSEHIYATEAECEHVLKAIQLRRPQAVLFCGEVYRSEN